MTSLFSFLALFFTSMSTDNSNSTSNSKSNLYLKNCQFHDSFKKYIPKGLSEIYSGFKILNNIWLGGGVAALIQYYRDSIQRYLHLPFFAKYTFQDILMFCTDIQFQSEYETRYAYAYDITDVQFNYFVASVQLFRKLVDRDIPVETCFITVVMSLFVSFYIIQNF